MDYKQLQAAEALFDRITKEQKAIINRVIDQLAGSIEPHVNASMSEEQLQAQIKGFIQANH